MPPNITWLGIAYPKECIIADGARILNLLPRQLTHLNFNKVAKIPFGFGQYLPSTLKSLKLMKGADRLQVEHWQKPLPAALKRVVLWRAQNIPRAFFEALPITLIWLEVASVKDTQWLPRTLTMLSVFDVQTFTKEWFPSLPPSLKRLEIESAHEFPSSSWSFPPQLQMLRIYRVVTRHDSDFIRVLPKTLTSLELDSMFDKDLGFLPPKLTWLKVPHCTLEQTVANFPKQIKYVVTQRWLYLGVQDLFINNMSYHMHYDLIDAVELEWTECVDAILDPIL